MFLAGEGYYYSMDSGLPSRIGKEEHDLTNPSIDERIIEWFLRKIPVNKVKERKKLTQEEQRKYWHEDIKHGWEDNVKDYYNNKEKPPEYEQLIKAARSMDNLGEYAPGSIINFIGSQAVGDGNTVKMLKATQKLIDCVLPNKLNH